MADIISAWQTMFIMILFIVPYIVPTIIAFNRQHPQRIPILLLNIFLGWTFVGWVVALVWSTTAFAATPPALPSSR
jgi:hypothetical protein